MLLHIAARQHDSVGRFMPPPCKQMKRVLQMSYNLKKKKRGLRILKHQQTNAYCFEKK